jgi:hypothetical protein
MTPDNDLDRTDLESMVAYALWRRPDLRPKKRSLDDARIWATVVVGHLELCGVRWSKPAPKPLHTTPEAPAVEDPKD